MVSPGPAVADAWAVPAAGRLAAILWKRRAEGPDCRWAGVRDSLRVMAELEHQAAREWRPAWQLQDELRRAAQPLELPVVPQALWDEWELLQVRAQPALPPRARSQGREPEPWARFLVQQARQPE